jgi:hypothetical protein
MNFKEAIQKNNVYICISCKKYFHKDKEDDFMIKIVSLKNKHKNARFMIVLILVLVFLFNYVPVSADYALSIDEPLGATYTICGLKNSVVTFSADAIEKQLSLDSGKLSGIIITDLPQASQGKLTICGADALLYETINRDGMNRLAFNPIKGCTDASFDFVALVPEKQEKVAKMVIALLDKPNSAPIAQKDSIATEKNISIQGTLKVTDDDIDSIKIKMITPPEKGELTLKGINYTYDPFLDMTGNDSFVFIAVDKYGSTSAKTTENIKIEKPQGKISYADMNGNPNNYAAVKLAEHGVIVGDKIGINYYFKPDEAITKGDFLVMLIAATNKESGLSPTVNTGLQNDTQIPMYMKPYVEKAKHDGIIGDKVSTTSFNYNDPVTKTEAVMMIDSAAQIPDTELSVPVFNNGTIPSWAMQSYINLYSNNILTTINTNVDSNGNLTRAEAAGMIWGMYNYCESHYQDLELN